MKTYDNGIESGEYNIYCVQCQFEGHWMNDPLPKICAPEKGCHNSAIQKGWCNSCNTIMMLYTGKAGRYTAYGTMA